MIALVLAGLGFVLVVRPMRARSRERQAVDALKKAGVHVSYSNKRVLGLFAGEYPSTILFGRGDASAVDWALIPRIQKLEQVQLEGCIHVDSALDDLAAVHTLRHLFLDDSDVTATGLAELAQNPARMSLSLAGTQLPREAFAAVVEIKGLEWLDLKGSRFDPASLSLLHQHPALEVLVLRDTNIDDHDIPILEGFTRLELMVLDETLDGTRLTPEGVAALRRKLPGVRVSWNGSE